MAEPILFDPNLGQRLRRMAQLMNDAGAEGIWLIRGAHDASLLIVAPDEKNAMYPVLLDIEDANIILIVRFPASDGGEEGIETL